jgi:hypothetical protein
MSEDPDEPPFTEEEIREADKTERYINDLIRDALAGASDKALTNERIRELLARIPGSSEDNIRQMLQAWLLEGLNEMPEIDLSKFRVNPQKPRPEGNK